MTQAASEETVGNEVQTDQEQEQQLETEARAGEQAGGEGGEQHAEHQEGEGDEVVVSIGDPPPPEEQEESRAPEWVRELRKQNREKDRVLREQAAEIARLKGSGQQPAAIAVGEKPTLEGCNYDAAKFETELDAWKERKALADDQQRKANEAQQDWATKLENYGKAKAALKIPDFQEAEEAVTAACNVVQQGVILNGADNPALVVAALGKNPQKLKELAAITDPVKFAFAVAKLETQVKVTPRKTAPPPERRVQSTVAGATAVDNTLEKLREEARKTGDMSKLNAYKRQQRQAAST